MNLTPLETLVVISTILEFNPIFQTVKSLRSGSVKDVSLMTFLSIMTIGGLWLYYGISIHNIPLIVGNIIKLFSSFTVVMLCFRHKAIKNVEEVIDLPPCPGLEALAERPGDAIYLVTRNYHAVDRTSSFGFAFVGNGRTYGVAIQELLPTLVGQMQAKERLRDPQTNSVSWEVLVEYGPEIAKVLNREVKIIRQFGGEVLTGDKDQQVFGPFKP